MNTPTKEQSNQLPSLPEQIPGLLLNWYDNNRRILPWREDPTPYHIWVSEIMLQQTRVDTVIPYYERFLKELPDIPSLAKAGEERLLKLWEGLGYYSRVRNMQKAARQIMENYNGKLPSDPAELEKLSGIGAYTAAAIASIAYGVRVPSVDGNLLRVYARLTAYLEDIRTPAAKKLAENAFLAVLDADRPGDMNQAFMDIGATICLPNGAPLCDKCPFRDICMAYSSDLIGQIPKVKEKTVRPVEKRTVLLIQNGEQILLHRRPQKGLLAGLYEFPSENGHLSADEVLNVCRSKGFLPSSLIMLKPCRHIFSHLEWDMTGYKITVEWGTFLENEDTFFVPVSDLLQKTAIPSAFSGFLKQFIA